MKSNRLFASILIGIIVLGPVCRAEKEKRAEVFDTLPAQLAAVYNRLVQRSRDGIAVAEVVSGSCSACNMALRPQMLLEVKRMNDIVTCESCTRILYVTQPAQNEAAAS